MDLIGPLPVSRGKDAILVIVDRFSKQIGIMFFICTEHQTKLFMIGVLNSRTDRQTGRVNQELEQYLRRYVNHHQNDWVTWLSLAEFAYNNRKHASTGFSPFFVNQGYHPNPYATSQSVLTHGMTNNAVVDFRRDMKKINEEVKANLERTNLQMRRNYDRHKRPAIEYKPGNMVWLSASNIPSYRPSKKLDHRYLGPYEVMEKVGTSAYRLKTTGRSTRHATFNES